MYERGLIKGVNSTSLTHTPEHLYHKIHSHPSNSEHQQHFFHLGDFEWHNSTRLLIVCRKVALALRV